MLTSDLCDYSESYIVVKERITVADPNNANYDNERAFTSSI